MNKAEFKTSLLELYPYLSDEFFLNIEKYKNFLQESNEKINLTKLAIEDRIYGNYFYESILPYKETNFSKINSVLDIGSGSGIPGILLKLLFPHIQLTIIESVLKKVTFIKELTNVLKLEGIVILHKRAEQINEDEYEAFDMVTSRAVAPLRIILEISVPYAKIGGLIIQPKSKNHSEEFKETKTIQKLLNIKLENELDFESKEGFYHHIYVFLKQNKTNRKFPRRWSQIIN